VSEKIEGYAPGFYSCKCRDCGVEYDGDKRSWQCKDCAKKTSLKRPVLDEEGFATYRDDDHQEYHVTGDKPWQVKEVKSVAELAAEEILNSDSDMQNPDYWPIPIEVKCGCGWVPVELGLSYTPSFTVKLKGGFDD
tara:strand:- start:297 stop:704 length:408 start_codon:yes stop_codon:yes gene_type:complete